MESHARAVHIQCMFLTIAACVRVGYNSHVWSEAEAPENVARTSVFNEIHTMVTLKCYKKSTALLFSI